jgi:beta-ketoacyl-acyl-carrier-protein synthase II
MLHRVVVTGMGTVNPCGLSVAETWTNITRGVSGVGPITLFDVKDLIVRIACEVKNFDPAQFMDPKDARRRDRYQQFAVAAAKEALHASGLEVSEANAERVAVIVSSAVGGIRSILNAAATAMEYGVRHISPFTIPMLMHNGASGLIGIDTGAKGPNFSVSSACASGADGIGAAWRLIRHGEVDAAITGASDATITFIGMGAFERMGAMSRRSDDYSMTPQPFDKNRDGLVMGEGAAILILESLEHARARGAEILGELAGYAATSDAFHITAPAADGSGSARAMQKALDVAGLNANEVDYINAHGTGTPLNDSAETVAIKLTFGERAYEIPVSSTKSMTGHMMGTTGALEAIFCVQAIRTGVIPPTIHYETPDPACDLDYVPNTAREARVDAALSNAFGFGGHNAVLALRRFTG